ncbi:Bug family tripartite tricarboxylate transporter substrate binding protein [Tropicibacter sp. S64]|uniref:Bug family tripartite tricarboxylate transporter substrate binding protein n=1 Tax=Tropicibacter sp. S64 TaxID=3415122 RepID=UPI003C7B270B
MHRQHLAAPGRRGVLKALVAAAGLACVPALALAADWPSGNIQLVVPAKPGGGTDAAARVIAGALAEKTGGNFVVVNVDGGGGAIAAEQIRTADPDGTHLLFYHSGLLSTYHTGGYQHSPIDEFTLIAALPVGGSYALAVNATSPYQTMDDLVAASKETPNKITLGVQLRGSTHFMAGLIAMDSDAAFRVVEAGSDADKLVQLQGKQIDAALINTPGTLQYVETGDLRILATISGSPERDPNAPDYASASELGYGNAVYGLDFLVMGPTGMDEGTVQAINAAFDAVLSDPAISYQLASMRLPISPMGVEPSRERLMAADKRIGATAKMLGLAN